MNEALEYAARGWRVFPCKPGDKTPITPNGCLDATVDASKIRSWWDRTPDANIGLATGKESGLAVIDLDGEEGIAEGMQMGLTSTMVSLTGEGRHLFYKYQDGVKNSVKKLAPHIDVRSDGGYVCVSPSLHPNGKRYTWLLGTSGELPDFPTTLMSTALGARSGPASPATWLSDVLAGLNEGNRNDTFARVVGKLHHSGLDKAVIWSLLLPHARGCHFSEKELNGVIQSITRYQTDTARTGSDSQHSSVESFLAEYTPVLWLCDPIIAHGTLGFVAGLPETMKTWVTIDLAVECAKGGGLWLGQFPVSDARVLFIDQERFKGETQRRFRGVMAAKGIEPSALRDRLFIKSGTTTRLDIDDSYRAFRQELIEIRPDLVIVDSFATFHVGDENDRMTIQAVLERIKELRNEIGCAFIFIDHENKGAYSANQNDEAPTAGRMAGSVGKVAAAEFVLTVRRYDPSTCMVYHTKSTLGPRVPSFTTHVVDTPDGGIKVYGESAK